MKWKDWTSGGISSISIYVGNQPNKQNLNTLLRTHDNIIVRISADIRIKGLASHRQDSVNWTLQILSLSLPIPWHSDVRPSWDSVTPASFHPSPDSSRPSELNISYIHQVLSWNGHCSCFLFISSRGPLAREERPLCSRWTKVYRHGFYAWIFSATSMYKSRWWC